MPYVNVRITRDGATTAQKAQIVAEITEMLQRILNKNPDRTFVVIDEVELDNWGSSGKLVSEQRKAKAAKPPR